VPGVFFVSDELRLDTPPLHEALQVCLIIVKDSRTMVTLT